MVVPPRIASVLSVVTIVTVQATVAAEEAGPVAADGSAHVVALLLAMEAPLRECLAMHAPRGEELQPAVTARLELPSGESPRVVTLDAWPGSVLDRCVREALASISTPTYEGPLQRHECVIPIGPGTLRCRPRSSHRAGAQSPPSTPTTEATAPRPVDGTPVDGGTRIDVAASSSRPRRNSITLNPLGVIAGGIDLKYTRAFRRSSLGAAVAIQLPPFLDPLGVMGVVEVLGWFGDRPLAGLYAGAALQVGGIFGSATVVGVGPFAVFGIRWAFRSGMTIGVGAYLGYSFYFSECTTGCRVRTLAGPRALDGDGRGGAFSARLAFDVGFVF
jgi:hypothetical protein